MYFLIARDHGYSFQWTMIPVSQNSFWCSSFFFSSYFVHVQRNIVEGEFKSYKLPCFLLCPVPTTLTTDLVFAVLCEKTTQNNEAVRTNI